MWENSHLDQAYDFVEFTLNNGQTNYDVKANQTSLWNNVALAQSCVIWTTQDITCRLNNTDFPALKIDADESPAEFKKILNISNLYLSNASGSNSTVRIMLLH